MNSSHDHLAGSTPPDTRPADPSFAPVPELSLSSISSDIRKAKIRAALFDKLEPVKVGRFTLLERLGAGTMGEIYAAYDERLDRAVALKLVRPGSQSTIKADELLLREAQALAQVSHTNVVQIYDAGTHGGRVFIAMELIRGGTLTSWLAEAAGMARSLRQREVLRQFIAAGHGLAAAHAAGVAHRDFKPDNVLVGKDGRVCVVDFGLARVVAGDAARSGATGDAPAIDAIVGETMPMADGREVPKLTAATRLTRTGMVMGTPRFMAPEQIRGGVPDHRSDQFSFCVALYHALYGAFPFRGERPQELLAAIEAGVNDLEHGAGLGKRLRKALCRGLSVDPSQRFPNMGELLAALEPGLRRRRGWIAGAVLLPIAAAAVAFVAWPKAADPCAAAGDAIAAAWSVDRQHAVRSAFEQSHESYADVAWRGVAHRLDDYAARWRAAALAACRATHVQRTQSDQQYDKRRLCLERGSRQVDALVTELTGGAPDVFRNAVNAAERLPDLDACNRTENLLFGVEPPAPAVAGDVQLVRDKLARARAREDLGRAEESLALARQAQAESAHLKYPPVRAEALDQIARALDARDNAEARREAEGLYFEALDIAEAERHDQLAASIWNRLTLLAIRTISDTKEARARWRRDAAAVARVGSTARDQAQLDHLMAEIDIRDGRYADATDQENRAIAALDSTSGHQLELARYHDALARSLVPQDRVDEALGLHAAALKAMRDALGPTHPDVLQVQMNYAIALKRQRQFDRARVELDAALDGLPREARDASLDAAIAHRLLSDVNYEDGKLDAAADQARTCLQIEERAGAPPHQRAETSIAIANIELKRKDFAAALAGYEAALALRRQFFAPDHPQIAVAEGSIAEALVGLARYDEAADHLRRALPVLDAPKRDPAFVAWILTVHGEVLVGQRQPAAAVPVLERALGMLAKEPDPSNEAPAAWTLARALHDLGNNPVRVRHLAEKARALFAALGAPEVGNRVAVEQFIARVTK
jgi:eukaryotic-like serine/threonine-protein kinase